MRVFVLLASASVLASCGGAGGGVSSLGSSAVTPPAGTATPTPTATATGTPTPSSTSTPAPTSTATPTPTATTTPIPGATPTPSTTPTPTPGVTGNTSTVIPPAATPTGNSMFDVSSAVSFKAVGAVHALDVSVTEVNGQTRRGTLYSGNAATAAAGTGTISYDPRDAVFELNFADSKAGVTESDRFQDPVHRIDFAGTRKPDAGVIQLTNYNYLMAGNATEQSIFFYQRPGNRTNYVTLAGYVHREVQGTGTREVRGALAFGAATPNAQLPRTGGGRYSGEFLASMVAKNADAPSPVDTTFQWINGQSAVDVDFGAGTVAVQLAGNVTAGVDSTGALVDDGQMLVRGGSSFNAAATAKLDIASGTFTGKFNTATFGSMNGTPLDFAAITPGSEIAGASSVDGSFYGPGAQEVGGSFRIIGGRPDQRVDVLGAFAGKK